ncbi:endo-1,4-beta-xylanase [Paenibacillus sp. LHD-117]|uniref:endo-1,4-beta-xylanase n=1 Tax=Paenibacillus sp. LHD-117 TaxID=3071412 RepID=UPI0027E15B60|nr:endo-1,4-beta-xylanase [Paenibacillus sp. LHD-117]MDQ6417849.1 endo-1,4-beta-xylanase [Paenibacillus sp. LHD-117]
MSWMRLKKTLALMLACALVISSAMLTAPKGTNAAPVSLAFDFEDVTTQGWFSRGDTLSISEVAAHSGNQALLSEGRTANWNGPGYDLTAALLPGMDYRFEAYVKLKEGEADANVSMTVARDSEGKTFFDTLAFQSPVSDDEWTKLSATYSYSGEATGLTVYFELPTSLGSFYVDDVSITEVDVAGPEPVVTDFEDGTTQGWIGRGGNETLTAVQEAAYSGAYGLKVENRQQGWNGPQLDLTSFMQSGNNYSISAWVKLPTGTADAPVSLLVQRSTGGTTYYERVAGKTVNDDGWVKVSGEYKLDHPVEYIGVYFESFDMPTLPFLIDDFRIEQVPPPEPIEIEQDIPNLKDVFADHFILGSSLLVEEIEDLEGPDAQLLKKHFNSLTAGNELKWDATEPVEGQFEFARADKIYDFAVQNDIAFRGHTLIWHSQTPEWVFYDEEGNLASKELLFARMKSHIDEVVGRYKGQIYAWDVVNEVIEVGDQQPNGLRNSLWYQIAGEEFIEKAFEYAHTADPDAKLYINDYNTNIPDKRQALYDLIKRLQNKGIPVHGIGHQTHIGIEYPAVQEIDQTIEKFRDLGIEQQITELDMSIYTNDSQSYETFPLELQLKQAHRYKEIFDVFKKHDDQITAVIFWGKDDWNTWLRTFPVTRNNWPLLFDERLQAKYAYWALVDPTKVPVEINYATARQGGVQIDAVTDEAWNRTPAIQVSNAGEVAFTFKSLWESDRLYVTADVTDSSVNASDAVEVFVDRNNGKTDAYEEDDKKYSFSRSGMNAPAGTTFASSVTDDGYRIEASIPLSDAEIGQEIGFDVRILDGEDQPPTIKSWNDTTNQQDTDTSQFGILTLAEGPLFTRSVVGTPTIDGEKDQIWSSANEISTERWVIGSDRATAKVRTLWDDEKLYVLAEVTDPLLSKESANAHEQDSVEIFIDQNNAASAYFEEDDGQYRINFDNEKTLNPASKSGNLVSATKRTANGYVVEAAILLDGITPTVGGTIGFDIQVNDDHNGDGARDSVAIWNDRSGLSWQSTTGYGQLTFVEAETEPGGGPGGGGNTPPTTPSEEPPTMSDVDFTAAIAEAEKSQLTIGAKVDDFGQGVLVLSAKQLGQAVSAGIKTIVVRSGAAILELPLALLLTDEESKPVKLTVGHVDPKTLPEPTQAILGNNQVFDFTLMVGGKSVTDFANGHTVKVFIPYELKTGDKKGQVVAYYIADDGTLEVVKNSRYKAGSLEFKVKHFSKYAAAVAITTFEDLNEAEWAREAIEAISARGIAKGISETTFAPNLAVTREQFIHLLVETFGLETNNANHAFSDGADGAYYELSVATAAKLGIVKGKTSGLFGVGEAISRQDMAVMLIRAIKAGAIELPKQQTSVKFADDSRISDYAEMAVSELQQANIVSGKPGNLFDPRGTFTRAEAASILYRILEWL